jgi:hypothetical protein
MGAGTSPEIPQVVTLRPIFFKGQKKFRKNFWMKKKIFKISGAFKKKFWKFKKF